MNIIILGAGQVGKTLAENLAHENNITIVDTDESRLRDLQTRLDIRTVCGSACHPNTLKQAGAEHADMLIAVTNQDEVNMIGCQIAYNLFQTPLKIARIRDHTYFDYPTLFQSNAIAIDVCISPELLVTHFVERLIEYPGSLQVLDFAEGAVQLVAVKPYTDSLVVGKTIKEIKRYLSHIRMCVAAIFRQNGAIPITDETMLEAGDEVFFVAPPEDIQEILTALGRADNPYKRIMIAGGGRIGMQLARALENTYKVKIIEHDAERTQYLSEKLHHSTVLLGDASDRELLLSENIDYIDVFCALTNDDEANIMSCLQAKRLGVRKVLALINRTNYVDLIEGSEVDIAISPQQATTSSILTYLRKGDISNVYSLRRGAAEALEIVAHGDPSTSHVVGQHLKDLALPPHTIVGAVVRGTEVFIGDEELILESDDHVILVLVDKKYIHDVERLFQVKLGYF